MFRERNLGGSIQQKTGTQTFWTIKLRTIMFILPCFMPNFAKLAEMCISTILRKKSIAENREKQEDSLQIQIPLIKAELFV